VLSETKSEEHVTQLELSACQKSDKQASILIEGQGGVRMRGQLCDIREERVVVGATIAGDQR
jgi:hypothetical protein